jgi:hypothetical protein
MSLRTLDLPLLLKPSDHDLYRDFLAPALYNLHSNRQAVDGDKPMR